LPPVQRFAPFLSLASYRPSAHGPESRTVFSRIFPASFLLLCRSYFLLIVLRFSSFLASAGFFLIRLNGLALFHFLPTQFVSPFLLFTVIVMSAKASCVPSPIPSRPTPSTFLSSHHPPRPPRLRAGSRPYRFLSFFFSRDLFQYGSPTAGDGVSRSFLAFSHPHTWSSLKPPLLSLSVRRLLSRNPMALAFTVLNFSLFILLQTSPPPYFTVFDYLFASRSFCAAIPSLLWCLMCPLLPPEKGAFWRTPPAEPVPTSRPRMS